MRSDAGYPECHLGAALAKTRHHDLIGRPACNFAVHGSLARDRKLVISVPKLVSLFQAADDLKMDFGHALTFGGHVQLVHNPITDRLYLRQHSRAAFAALGIPKAHRPYVPASGDPPATD